MSYDGDYPGFLPYLRLPGKAPLSVHCATAVSWEYTAKKQAKLDRKLARKQQELAAVTSLVRRNVARMR